MKSSTEQRPPYPDEVYRKANAGRETGLVATRSAIHQLKPLPPRRSHLAQIQLLLQHMKRIVLDDPIPPHALQRFPLRADRLEPQRVDRSDRFVTGFAIGNPFRFQLAAQCARRFVVAPVECGFGDFRELVARPLQLFAAR